MISAHIRQVVPSSYSNSAGGSEVSLKTSKFPKKHNLSPQQGQSVIISSQVGLLHIGLFLRKLGDYRCSEIQPCEARLGAFGFADIAFQPRKGSLASYNTWISARDQLSAHVNLVENYYNNRKSSILTDIIFMFSNEIIHMRCYFVFLL